MSDAALRVARFAPPLILGALLASGCEKAPETSMDLLRTGNPGICTAGDVENTVRRLIYPDGKTHEGYTIAFADASLEAFDQVVSRATCNAALTIDGPDGTIVERTMIDFVVAPAAQDQGSFIVSGSFSGFAARIKDAVETAAAERAEAEDAKQEHEALAALVKPGWLIGRWVPASTGSDACINGPFDDFGQKGQLTTQVSSGRWSLKGMEISYVMPGRSGSTIITNATMNEFTAFTPQGEESRHRRCEIADYRGTAVESLDPRLGMDEVDDEPVNENLD